MRGHDARLAPRSPLGIALLSSMLLTISAHAAPAVDDAATLRRLVLEDYRALWTKRDGRFSIAPADRHYANGPDLKAIDTDLANIRLTPDQRTRINGYSDYRAIWPAVWARVRGFERTIGPVDVRIYGAWAITTFDGDGTYTALDRKRTPTHKNFTLVWERRSEDWRIFHEHISDGR